MQYYSQVLRSMKRPLYVSWQSRRGEVKITIIALNFAFTLQVHPWCFSPTYGHPQWSYGNDSLAEKWRMILRVGSRVLSRPQTDPRGCTGPGTNSVLGATGPYQDDSPCALLHPEMPKSLNSRTHNPYCNQWGNNWPGTKICRKDCHC